jgi:hypothetical protein
MAEGPEAAVTTRCAASLMSAIAIDTASSTGTVDNIVGNRPAYGLKPQEFNALHNLHKL